MDSVLRVESHATAAATAAAANHTIDACGDSSNSKRRLHHDNWNMTQEKPQRDSDVSVSKTDQDATTNDCNKRSMMLDVPQPKSRHDIEADIEYEIRRLQTLKSYHFLLEPEVEAWPALDRRMQLACRLLSCQAAGVAVLDLDRQYITAWHNELAVLDGDLPTREWPRDDGLSAPSSLWLSPADDVHVFEPHQQVLPAFCRHYNFHYVVAAPLRNAHGFLLGFLYVMHPQLQCREQAPTDGFKAVLSDLAAAVVDLMEVRRRNLSGGQDVSLFATSDTTDLVDGRTVLRSATFLQHHLRVLQQDGSHDGPARMSLLDATHQQEVQDVTQLGQYVCDAIKHVDQQERHAGKQRRRLNDDDDEDIGGDTTVVAPPPPISPLRDVLQREQERQRGRRQQQQVAAMGIKTLQCVRHNEAVAGDGCGDGTVSPLDQQATAKTMPRPQTKGPALLRPDGVQGDESMTKALIEQAMTLNDSSSETPRVKAMIQEALEFSLRVWQEQHGEQKENEEDDSKTNEAINNLIDEALSM